MQLLSNGNTRLAGSLFTNMGRVEVYYNGSYGTVCDDRFSNLEIDVICRDKGFGSNGSMIYFLSNVVAISNSIFTFSFLMLIFCVFIFSHLVAVSVEKFDGYGSGNIQVFLDNVVCRDSRYQEDETLGRCLNDGFMVHDCYILESVGVICDCKCPLCNYKTVRQYFWGILWSLYFIQLVLLEQFVFLMFLRSYTYIYCTQFGTTYYVFPIVKLSLSLSTNALMS